MNKKRATYNISTSVLAEFEEFASKAAANKSRLIELLISNWISNQKKSNEKKT
jgi:hypothetical protein